MHLVQQQRPTFINHEIQTIFIGHDPPLLPIRQQISFKLVDQKVAGRSKARVGVLHPAFGIKLQPVCQCDDIGLARPILPIPYALHQIKRHENIALNRLLETLACHNKAVSR